MPELPRHFTIRESSHRIINPLSPEKLRQLGEALFIRGGSTMLDLGSGKGELLCTWARDHNIRGVGIDISSVFTAKARARSVELGVGDRVMFVHDDARGYVNDVPVDIACCVGATWIGDGIPGTIELLKKSLKPGGIMLIGHPYWRNKPDSQDVLDACEAEKESDWLPLPELIAELQAQDCDVIEMMLADQDSWDRYVAAQWRNIREFIDANPHDELTPEFIEELHSSPITHTKYVREYLGWGVFALKAR